MMHRESLTEEKTRKISLLAYLCTLQDNCALLSNSNFSMPLKLINIRLITSGFQMIFHFCGKLFIIRCDKY